MTFEAATVIQEKIVALDATKVGSGGARRGSKGEVFGTHVGARITAAATETTIIIDACREWAATSGGLERMPHFLRDPEPNGVSLQLPSPTPSDVLRLIPR